MRTNPLIPAYRIPRAVWRSSNARASDPTAHTSFSELPEIDMSDSSSPEAVTYHWLGSRQASSDNAATPKPTIPLATDETDSMTAAFRR